MSGEHNRRLSVIAPHHAQLLEDPRESPFVRDIKEALNQDLQKQCQSGQELITLHVAFATDAKFKAPPFLSEDERHEPIKNGPRSFNGSAARAPTSGQLI